MDTTIWRWRLALAVCAASFGCSPGYLYRAASSSPKETDSTDTAVVDTGTEQIEGGFAARVDQAVIAIFVDDEGDPDVYALLTVSWINTWPDRDMEGVEPGVVDTFLAADDTPLFSFSLDLAEPWDRVVPAGEQMTLDYLATELVEAPDSLRDVPCTEQIYGVVDVRSDGGADFQVITDTIELACDL